MFLNISVRQKKSIEQLNVSYFDSFDMVSFSVVPELI